MNAENEEAFREFLEHAVSQQLNGQRPTCEIVADAELDAGAATMKLISALDALEPFGQGNPEPTFILHGAMLRFATIMGAGLICAGRSQPVAASWHLLALIWSERRLVIFYWTMQTQTLQ